MVRRRTPLSGRAPALLVVAALAFAGLLSAEALNPSTAAAAPVSSPTPTPTPTPTPSPTPTPTPTSAAPVQKARATGPTAVDDSVTVGYPAITQLAGPSNDKAGSSPIVPSLTVFPADGQTRGTTIKDGGHTIEVADHGTFRIGNGAPNANFETWLGRTGTVSVRYRITDANGLTADGLLTVVVTAGGAYDNVDAYQGTTVTGVDVLTNDTPGRNADGTAGTLDPASLRFPVQQYADVTSVSADGRTATFEDGSVATFDAHGLLTFTAATPALQDRPSGGAAFYTARDTTVAADGTVQHHSYQSEVRLYGDVNHVVPADDHGATPFDASLVVPYLANDTDTNPAYRLRPDLTTFTGDPGPGGYLAPDKRKLRYPGGGTWIINPDGTVLYIPVRGAAGVGKDDATVTVYDDHGHSAYEDLEVNVEPGPEAHRDRPSTPQNVATTIAVLANDEPGTSADGTAGSMDPSSVRFPTDGQLRYANVSSDHRTLSDGDGSYTIDRVTGAISFQPSFRFTGTAQPVTYTAHDTVKRTDGRLVHNGVTSTLSVTVTPVTPVALNNWATTPFGQPVAIAVLANDHPGAASAPLLPYATRLVLPAGLPEGSHLDRGGLGLTVAGDGVFAVDEDGVVTFTPAVGFHGRVPTIGYTIEDTNATFASATITVVVQGPTAAGATKATTRKG